MVAYSITSSAQGEQRLIAAQAWLAAQLGSRTELLPVTWRLNHSKAARTCSCRMKKSLQAARELPVNTMCAAMIVALIADEKDTAVSVLTLIAVASRMAKFLPLSVRTAVVWHLAEAMEELGGRWN